MNAELLPGRVPEGYHEVLYWKLSEAMNGWRMLLFNLFGAVIFFVTLGIGLVWWSMARGRMSGLDIQFWSVVAGFGLMVIGHEAMHGFMMRLYGAHPRYGAIREEGLPLAFYTTAEGFAFRRTAYLLVTLAPAVGLSVLLLLALLFATSDGVVTLGLSMLAFNVSGALGDGVIAWIVARYPKEAYVIDERDGMRIFLPLDKATGSPVHDAKNEE